MRSALMVFLAVATMSTTLAQQPPASCDFTLAVAPEPPVFAASENILSRLRIVLQSDSPIAIVGVDLTKTELCVADAA